MPLITLTNINTLLWAAFIAASLSGCASVPPSPWNADAQYWPQASETAAQGAHDPRADSTAASAAQSRDASTEVALYPGTGSFIRRPPPPSQRDTRTGEISLNFEDADLRAVTRHILGEILGKAYVLDPAVQGQVSLKTDKPLTPETLLSVFEQVLAIHGAALIEGDGIYQIVPRDGALRASPGLDRQRPGLSIRIIPLRYIGAREMQGILEPLLSAPAVLRVDPVRNLLILSGTRQELSQWQDMINAFDVNLMQGMSAGLFTLKHIDIASVTAALEGLTGGADSPLAGLLRVVPIEPLNAVLLITPQPDYLEEARRWVARLDQARHVNTPRLYVYRLENADAQEVAAVLGEIYAQESRSAPSAPRLAPGQRPVQLSTDGQSQDSHAATPTAITTVTAAEQGAGLEATVRIVADDRNNALLILATPTDYELMETAIRQLDIPGRQVLVDATIIEVSLTDELRYGLQWFFRDHLDGYRGSGTFATAESAQLARSFPGFNYSIVDSANQVRAVLSALAQDSRVNVLSSPSVMVLDKHSALIRVGDQVPIRSTETTSVVTDNPLTVTSIEYRDTGVSLEVTPRISSGGMVVLDIQQEVNDVSTTTSSSIDSPTIKQRLIKSSVAVQSGETIVLGGLILDSSGQNQSGVPGIHKLPVLGALFGATSRSTRRTELVVLLTPRVVEDTTQARQVTEAFRQRLQGLGSLSHPE